MSHTDLPRLSIAVALVLASCTGSSCCRSRATGVVGRLQIELNQMKASRLKPADYRVALRQFTDVYVHLDAVQRADLLAYLLDRVEVRPVMQEGKVVATEITIALLGEPREIGRYEKRADGGYHQLPEWLRLLDSNQRLGG